MRVFNIAMSWKKDYKVIYQNVLRIWLIFRRRTIVLGHLKPLLKW